MNDSPWQCLITHFYCWCFAILMRYSAVVSLFAALSVQVDKFIHYSRYDSIGFCGDKIVLGGNYYVTNEALIPYV